MDWWSDWKMFQALPYPGTVRDQPYYVYQAISACEIALVAIQSERKPEDK